MLGKFLCFIGLHSWKKLSNFQNCFGMGLETFEGWHCRRCMTDCDQLKGEPRTRQTYRDLEPRA